MGQAALALARAVDYASAGTCEFLLDARGEFTFLEMNTRLQVEHPVTELVCGRDLVADQLRIAAGELLGFVQGDVQRSGHAIEVRLYAEDAESGFLPATGRIERLRWPTGDGIRVDAGVDEGDEVGGRFDPMLAKIVAHGRDRTDALDRLSRALDETLVLGLTTNLRFLRWLVREPVVRDGLARTDTLDRVWPPDDWTERAVVPDDAWRTAAAALADVTPASAWSGGWRLNAAPSVRLEAAGQTRVVEPAMTGDHEALRADDVVHVDVAGRSVAFTIAPPPDVDRAARAAVAHEGGPAEIVAPMPGQVRDVHVVAGMVVEAGTPLVALEAMKMEHEVAAPIAGRVTDLRVQAGDQVARGQLLVVVEP
jgi:acetyl-CoA/propionyl-CoA carboxylase biotin carboxyl carrier protein